MAMLALSSVAAAAATPRYAKCGVAPGMCRSAAMASVGVRRSSFLRGDGGVIRVSSLEVREGRAVVAVRAVSAPASEGMRSLYIAVGIPLVLGFVDAIFNSPLQKWYFDLRKPKWQPPGPIFGGAWSLLYPLMGLASWLVWAEGGFAKQAVPLALYAVQLALNLAWQALFFGAKRLGAAFYDILALDAALVATIVAFQRVNPVAANLLKPYLAWVLFATALSWRLWELNPDSTVDPSSPLLLLLLPPPHPPSHLISFATPELCPSQLQQMSIIIVLCSSITRPLPVCTYAANVSVGGIFLSLFFGGGISVHRDVE